MTDVFTPNKRSEIMSRIRNRNTDIEIVLRKNLWSKGCRYRLKYKLPGSPDIIFPRQKVAIFCDGNFWHGHNYDKEKLKYSKFWKEKIKKNIRRDAYVRDTLRKNGWKVLSFWETEIIRKTKKCIDKIIKELKVGI